MANNGTVSGLASFLHLHVTLEQKQLLGLHSGRNGSDAASLWEPCWPADPGIHNPSKGGASAQTTGPALSRHYLWQTSKTLPIPSPQDWQEFWEFLQGKAHCPWLQSFTEPWNYTELFEGLL